MNGALIRYRVFAYLTGVMLLILVFVAVPLKYLADRPATVAIVGPVHGFLYMVYLVFAFDLAVRNRWPFVRTLLVLLAGTVPGMSFVAERKVTRWVHADHPELVSALGRSENRAR
jgi:integral membrane protein